MLPIQGSIIRAAPAVCRTVIQKRNTAVAGLPRNRISFPEKLAHGAVIAAGMLSIPVYVLTHLQQYKSRD